MCEKLITRSVRAKKETFDKFIEICELEGRKQAKMLDILVELYFENKYPVCKKCGVKMLEELEEAENDYRV